MIEHKKVSFFWKQYWRHALRHSLGGPPGGSSTRLSFAQRGYVHGTCILTKPPHSWSHNGHAVPESYKSQKINPKESHSLCASPVGNVNLDSVLSFLCVILYLSKKKTTVQRDRKTTKPIQKGWAQYQHTSLCLEYKAEDSATVPFISVQLSLLYRLNNKQEEGVEELPHVEFYYIGLPCWSSEKPRLWVQNYIAEICIIPA